MAIELTNHSFRCIAFGVVFGSVVTASTITGFWIYNIKVRNTDLALVEAAKCEAGFHVNVATSQGGGFGCGPVNDKRKR